MSQRLPALHRLHNYTFGMIPDAIYIANGTPSPDSGAPPCEFACHANVKFVRNLRVCMHV